MTELNVFDQRLKVSAQAELQSRMETISREVARRQEERDDFRKKADEQDAAIVELLRLHDEYQSIVGRGQQRVTVINADTTVMAGARR